MHNFFLEPGSRNSKLKVYELVDHPAARPLTGYLLVRGGVAPGRLRPAVENLTGADLIEAVPLAADPDRQDPASRPPHIERGEHTKLYRFSPSDYHELRRGVQQRAPARRVDELVVVEEAPEGLPFDLPYPEAGVVAPGYAREEIAETSKLSVPSAHPTSRPASLPTSATAS